MNEVIELMVNRRIVQIPAKSIVYANVTDKLCKIHLDNADVLSLFITISELMEKLGVKDFLRISRSSLVSYRSIRSINQDEVLLFGDVHLPYSRSRRKEIGEKTRECIERLMNKNEATNRIRPLDCEHSFGFWDRVPVGFCVLDFVEDASGYFTDFVYRYVNQALADIMEIPRERMQNRAHSELFPKAVKKWTALYSKVAFLGETVETIDYSPELDKELLVICYQPSYGYCACILCDATNKYYLQSKW